MFNSSCVEVKGTDAYIRVFCMYLFGSSENIMSKSQIIDTEETENAIMPCVSIMYPSKSCFVSIQGYFLTAQNR